MLSRASEYAIRALVYVVLTASEDSKASIKQIAAETGSPVHFTGKILQDLARHGLITSVKGPNGGFYVEPGKQNIRLMQVIQAIEGNRLFTKCGMGFKDCSETEPCPMHEDYKKVRDGFQNLVCRETIQSLAEKIESGNAFVKRSDA